MNKTRIPVDHAAGATALPFAPRTPRRHLIALAVLAACSQAAWSEDADATRYRPAVALPTAGTPPRPVFDGAYAANAKVGQIALTLSSGSAPADGVTPVRVDVEVLDRQGLPMQGSVMLTLENSGGRLQLAGAGTDEFGPGALDADKNLPGTQLKVENGHASFSLLAPGTAQDVTLRATAGAAEVKGSVSFTPDLREMIVAGLAEGVISLNRRQYDANVVQAGTDDGFEQSLRAWSRSFHDGEGTVAARGAVFLKGKIKGDALLTLAYDSDKPPQSALLSQVKPEEFYPVYGDGATTTHDAISASKLYVRVDKDHSFLMYGDFTTAQGFSEAAGTGLVAGSKLRRLGAYNLISTGVRGHYENEHGFVNGFVTRDTLKQLVQEWAANGTSGPFAVDNSSGLQNSEQIEIIVRDKNVLNHIVSVTPLTRLTDYVFEPFSGRVLLTRPIASLDPDGNPVSLRITYAVDQGGSPYWLGGVDGEVNLGSRVVTGGSVVDDRNPTAPFRLESGNIAVQLGPHTTLVAELARTDSVPSLTTIGVPATTSVATLDTVEGRAGRIEIEHKDDTGSARVWANRTGSTFANPSSSAVAGTQEGGASGSLKVTPNVTVVADAQKTTDLTADATRATASAGIKVKLGETLEVQAGVRRIEEHGVVGTLQSGLASNPAPGSYFAPASSGGFDGQAGSSLQNVNNASSSLTGSASSATAGDLSATTVYVGAKAKVTDKISVEGLVEAGDNEEHRVVAGIGYQLAERSRVYLRGESQTGLGSAYSLDTAQHSNAVSLGVDAGYMEGGNVYSEYRLRDADTERDAQIATGVRNVWHIAPGIGLTTGAERLTLLSGSGQSATALTLGSDYTASPLWKGSARLEWRRLDAPAVAVEPTDPTVAPLGTQDTWLSTVAVARSLDRDWTLLGRNYLLVADNHGVRANGWQDRFQIGTAYRPVDVGTLDVLSKYEYKTENNIAGDDAFRRVHVVSVQGSWHPSRPWWVEGRVAAKSVVERFPDAEGGAQDSYRAALLGGRLIYDVTENWDLGLTGSVMASGSGTARQSAIGAEVGYLLRENLWLSAGYNATGFSDADLTSDYTARGVYLRLRFKFDQDLFSGSDKNVNRALDR